MKKYRNTLWFLLILILFGSCTQKVKQDVIPKRGYYQAPLEPVDGIIHGAGQSAEAFDNYTNTLDSTTRPLIFMVYTGLRNAHPETRINKWKEEYQQNSWYLIPQIGLSMTRDGSPEEHYEHLVAEGGYDRNIESFFHELKNWGVPVYLRIGFEFNGHWNGYYPDTYKKAFVRIADKAREYCEGKIALLWCMSPDGSDKDFMKYYPGDDYVDWWSIDLFSPWHLEDSVAHTFMDSALAHSKPVMIGESTPRRAGVPEGEKSWNEWFIPYFDFIYKYPNMKGFCYINWDWSQYPQWQDWGDCRIEMNDSVRTLYQQEMNKAGYIHGTDSLTTLKILGVI